RVHSVNGEQTRGGAWGGRVLDQADYFEPATSPIAQYLHDIETDNADWNYLYHTGGTAPAKMAALGYFVNDVNPFGGGGAFYQWWMDDFLFLQMGVQAWRDEYPNYRNFLTQYFYKQVIGRMNPNVGGCLWGGPSRVESIYPSNTWSTANLPQNW